MLTHLAGEPGAASHRQPGLALGTGKRLHMNSSRTGSAKGGWGEQVLLPDPSKEKWNVFDVTVSPPGLLSGLVPTVLECHL